MASRKVVEQDPLEAARQELQALRRADDWDDADDRLTPVIHVHAFPPGAVAPAAEPVRAIPSTPAPASLRSVAPRTTLELAAVALKRFPQWGFVLVVIVALLVYAFLAIHGAAPR